MSSKKMINQKQTSYNKMTTYRQPLASHMVNYVKSVKN
jgi:hypothetical protein